VPPASRRPSAPSQRRRRRNPPRSVDHPVDREALELLDREVAPRLGKEHRHLEKIVRSVVAHQRLEELATRPERDRRDLLGILEERVASARGPGVPPAVVRLTNLLSAIPVGDDPLGRWRTSPAR
jgi:hypothetical protein